MTSKATDVSDELKCSCMEIEGEDPDCPLHEMTIEGIAAWEDWQCATIDLDGYTARNVARKHLATLSPPLPSLDVERLREALEPFARLLKRDDPRTSDAAIVVVQYGFTKMYGLCLRDLRRAAEALSTSLPSPLRHD